MTPIHPSWDQKIGEVYICSANALDFYMENLVYKKERFDRLSQNELQILTNRIVLVERQLKI
jgi:hypothetical protein